MYRRGAENKTGVVTAFHSEDERMKRLADKIAGIEDHGYVAPKVQAIVPRILESKLTDLDNVVQFPRQAIVERVAVAVGNVIPFPVVAGDTNRAA